MNYFRRPRNLGDPDKYDKCLLYWTDSKGRENLIPLFEERLGS